MQRQWVPVGVCPPRREGLPLVMTLFNHAYTIAFSVDTDNPPDRVTADELKAGLARRLADLLAAPGDQIVEACGAPFDSAEHVHMLDAPPTVPYHVWTLLRRPT